jgi:hypothetical protein
MPDFGGFRQIIQSPEAISVFYDTGQGQGWQRVIPISSAPHLPANVRTWWGDSRARWEGNTLVVDVTNFNGFQDFQGSTDNLPTARMVDFRRPDKSSRTAGVPFTMRRARLRASHDHVSKAVHSCMTFLRAPR